MADQQIQTLTDAVIQLSQYVRELSARHAVTMFAVQALIKASPAKPAIADHVRDCVQEELQELADQPDQDVEAMMTLALAAILEMAGQPPKR
jgi:hypothetical protein